MELAVPPLPHHQGLSFWILLSLVLCQAAVVASVLCTDHTVRFPSFVTLFPLLAYPFPIPGQSSFYLSVSPYLWIHKTAKRKRLGIETLSLTLLKGDSNSLSPCLDRALNLSLPLAQLSEVILAMRPCRCCPHFQAVLLPRAPSPRSC